MRDVDPESGDTAVEPEAIDVVEGIADRWVPPVEVRLLGEEIMQIVLARVRVERPRRPPEGAQPVVRRIAIRLGIGPDIPIAVCRAARGSGIAEPRVPIAAVIRHDVEHDLDVAL